MKSWVLSAVCIAVVLVVVVGGEMYAYVPDDRGFSADAGYEGTTVDYEVSAKGAYTYRSTLFDNGGMTPVSKVYIYLDHGYASFVDDGRVVAVGAQAMTQDYYVDQLIKNLRFRGISDVTVVNASELKDKLTADLADTPRGKGLVIASGAAPDTVFYSSDILMNWIDAGGYLYWGAGPIGKYCATTEGLVEANQTAAFIGTDSYVTENGRCLEDTELRGILYFNFMYSRYSPDIDAIRASGRTALGTGYYDGEGHYTVTSVKIGNGQACIHSGDYNTDQIKDISINISSGLCPLTKVVATREAEFNRSSSGTFETTSPAGMSVYIAVGQYFPVFAQRFDL